MRAGGPFMIRIALGAWLCCALLAGSVFAQSKPSTTRPSTTTPSTTSPIGAVDGHWEGAIKTPGPGIAILIDLKREGGNFSGTIDIPQQGAKALTLEAITVDGSHVTFAIRGVPGKPRF